MQLSTSIVRKIAGLLALCCLISSCAFFGSDDPVFTHNIEFPIQGKLDYQTSFDINMTRHTKHTYAFFLNYFAKDDQEYDKALNDSSDLENGTKKPIFISITVQNEQKHIVHHFSGYEMLPSYHRYRVAGFALNKDSFRLKKGQYHIIIRFQSDEPYSFSLKQAQVELSTNHKAK